MSAEELDEVVALLRGSCEYKAADAIVDLVAENERLHERLMSEQAANLDLKRSILKIGPPDVAVNWRKPSVIGGLVILIVIAGDLIGSWPKSLF